MLLQLGAVALLVLSASHLIAAPTISGVLNGATFRTGGVAPGTLVSIFGSGLASTTSTATTVPLPMSLAGTSATVGGIPMPLLFVSPGQINAQIPYGIPQGSISISVRDASGSVASSAVQVVAASPGVFTKTLNGRGEAIATHSDAKLINRSVGQYAIVGETIVIYCSGLGEVNGPSVAGSPAVASPLPNARQPVEVTMDGRPARVVYAGLTPGSVGLYQINVVVPGEIGGDVTLLVRSGSAISNESTINVAGTFSLAANYSGTLTSRNGADRFQLEFSSMSSTATPGLFTGNYSLSQAGRSLDVGSFQFRTSSSFFTLTGKSIDGSSLLGVVDTLDAGNSFIGVLMTDLQVAESWYASFEVTRRAPSPPSGGTTGLPGGAFSCGAVEGASLFSQDGRFLGKITSNRFDQDSIGNQFGPYGSPYSATSIFNTFGAYGSQFSSTSPFNQSASTPPIIAVNGRPQWYFTTNLAMGPRVLPTQIYPCIGRQ